MGLARTTVIALVAIGCGITGAGVLMGKHLNAYAFTPTIVEETIVSFGPEEELWEARIRAVGGDHALEDFMRVVSPQPYSQRHLRAHTFGAAVYDTLGVDGFHLCTVPGDRFEYGCLHEFLSRTIYDDGLDAVQTLNWECVRAFGPNNWAACQHGLGHGLVGYFGYDPEQLLEALQVCDSIAHTRLEGCYAGVFMEYNLRIMAVGDGSDPRPLVDGDVMDPCSWLPEEYFNACVVRQPQWWHLTTFADTDTTAAFAGMGTYCRELARDAESSRLCFKRIGTQAFLVSDPEAGELQRLCDVAAETIDERIACRWGVAWWFEEVAHLPVDTLCSDISSHEYKRCTEAARSVQTPLCTEEL